MSETKTKKSKKGKIIIGVIIVIVLFIIAVNASSNDTPKKVSNGNNTSSSQQTNFKMGSTIKMGNYNVTIDSLYNTKSIAYDGITASSTQNNFAIVKLTLENNSNNPVQGFWVGNNNVFTLHADNSNYSVDFNNTLNANDAHNTSNPFNVLNGTQLSPHTKYTCYITFTTPHPVKNGSISINISQETAKVQI